MINLLYPVLAIDAREADFTRRGFTCTKPAVRERLERIGKTFLHGYHAALREPNQQRLAATLEEIQLEFRGFGYEGAAMALVLMDGIMPWQRRFSHFVEGAGKHHVYMLHVGAGWACARLPWMRRRIEAVIRKFHPVLGWLAIDGYGFHEGYFHWRSALQPKIAALTPLARHVFYQGLGRSLWFVKGANAVEIARTIAAFAPEYHADAWSGVGLACAYAEGMSGDEVQELGRCAAPYGAALAQGAAFAAKARLLAGNPAPHTEIACRIFCAMTAEKAAALCDETLAQVEPKNPAAYQEWRELAQEKFRSAGRELEAEPIAAHR